MSLQIWPKTMIVVGRNLLKSSGLLSISLWFDWLSVLLIPRFSCQSVRSVSWMLVHLCWPPRVGCRTGDLVCGDVWGVICWMGFEAGQIRFEWLFPMWSSSTNMRWIRGPGEFLL